MSESIMVALIAGLFGAGGIGAILKHWSDHKNGIREAATAEDKATIEVFEKVIRTLTAQVDRLTEKQERQETRIARLEEAVDEERDLKYQAVSYARLLITWITHHVPGRVPPGPPASLDKYFVIAKEEE